MGIKITGLGKAVPDRILTNDEMSHIVDTNDEWIKSRTGICKRHIATTETTSELAASAAREAMKEAGCKAEELDLIIVATVSPDTTMPSTACLVAQQLGAYNATCFDIAAACSGFITASEIACAMLGKGYTKALVIGAEVLSRMVDWEDRTTCILFADGAGAVIYETADWQQILAIETGSDPRGAAQIRLPVAAGNHRFFEAGKEKAAISMDGRSVYVFATTRVPQSIQSVLRKAGLEAEDISHYILHQANSRIMDHVAQKLGVPKERFFKNLSEYGNTSAASIPMALYDAKGLIRPGEKVILSGFGAGLTWGTMLIEW